MIREALKFTDLDAFLSVMDEQGLAQQAKDIIYEGGKLPYCSAYLIPTDLLPTVNHSDIIDQFWGTITHVEEINYIGAEQFYTDFMVYPLSMSGFVELDGVSPVTFASNQSEKEWDTKHMVYVINLEDGTGEEFFLTVGGKLIPLSSPGQEESQEFKSFKVASKRISQIRDKYPATCRIYALERRDFDKRRQVLQITPAKLKGEHQESPE